MNFQYIAKVEDANFHLDLAFRRAKSRVDRMPHRKYDDYLSKLRAKELVRINAVARQLDRRLTQIVKVFPAFDRLTPFYYDLTRATLDVGSIKKSLGAVQWSDEQVNRFSLHYANLIRGARSVKKIQEHKKAFFGRVSSSVKQVDKHLKNLEEARAMMKTFPHIKEMPTVVIAGYPNVGKSTLLKMLTGSAPKIAPYPFTTQNLMLGYFSSKSTAVQVIDTPGVLDRPISSMKPSERQAMLALKHLASAIIFIIDPSDYSGYSIKDQLALKAQVEKSFTVPVILVASKSDIAVESVADAVNISAENNTGIRTLRHRLNAIIKNIPKLL